MDHAVLIGLAVGLFGYFAPTIIAQARGHRNWIAIAILNVFAGWTVIGWIVALVWAVVRGPEYVEYEES